MVRSLSDAHDGLKPVHRRLIHVMRSLRFDPDAGGKIWPALLSGSMMAAKTTAPIAQSASFHALTC
jgi:hypothetical protein